MLDTIPIDVIHFMIFNHLNIKDIIRLSVVNKKLNIIVNYYDFAHQTDIYGIEIDKYNPKFNYGKLQLATYIENLDHDYHYINKIKFIQIGNITDNIDISLLNGTYSLFLHNVNISDVSMLSDVYNLNLCNTQITDVSNLSNVKCLDISNTSVTDVSNLSNVKYLDISNTFVTDVSNLGNVHTLLMYNTDVSDVSDLVNVHTLDISNTNVTNVSNLANVRILSMIHTDIHDISGLHNVNILLAESENIRDFTILPKLHVLHINNHNIMVKDNVILHKICIGYYVRNNSLLNDGLISLYPLDDYIEDII